VGFITESFYDAVKLVFGNDIDLIEDLKLIKEFGDKKLCSTTDKTDKIAHLYLKVKLHGIALDIFGHAIEGQERAAIIVETENFKILQILNHVKSMPAWNQVELKNPAKELLSADIDIEVYNYKNLELIERLHFDCRPGQYIRPRVYPSKAI
jgi:hypothetical protein